jgi:pyruvate dehydrogenase E2 component (dihydrolipoamide acetyltransferase)
MPNEIEIRVPDIGDFEDVEVVEILVAKGDTVALDDSLVSIESDKATMEIPAPVGGVVQDVRVALGDRVSEGSLLVTLMASSEAADAAPAAPVVPDADPTESIVPATAPTASPVDRAPSSAAAVGEAAKPPPVQAVSAPVEPGARPHASPLVRGVARELGVDLERASGSGPHGRILEQDVKAHVRERMQSGVGAGPAPAPAVDFSRFGPVEDVPLGKVRRVAARNLTRSWLTAPHVTQHDEADVTELEGFRRQCKQEAADRGLKLSPLHFVLKSLVVALREFSDFRSSLAPGGESLIVKGYYHLGVAVDTEHGLVVPVIRDVDQKGVYQLAAELAELAERARARRLAPDDMQGACFSVSSLGGIGGTSFTPIVNTPEVAILGLSKLTVRPVWSAGLDPAPGSGGSFEPRVILPLSLSYDHRVIDGAVAARFTSRLAALLSHPANLLL